MNRIDAEPVVDKSRYVRNEEMTRRTRSVALREDFSADELDARRWNTRLWAPNSSVKVRDGQAELVNRGYLATAEQLDPVKLGGVRITGKWRFMSPEGATDNAEVNIMTIAVRSGLEASEKWYEAKTGITFTCHTSSRWASITARGGQLEITKDRRITNLGRDPSDTYEFEIIDDGNNVSFKFWHANDPTNVAHSTATVTRDESRLNHIVFYCRETQPPDWTYAARLDDILIETGVGPVP
jgi:hypothetical protein